MSYFYFPLGGDLVVVSTPGSGYASSIPSHNSTLNGMTENNSSNTSVSKTAFEGGVIGAAFGGFILGALALYGFYKFR
jgi:hypothetical protein